MRARLALAVLLALPCACGSDGPGGAPRKLLDASGACTLAVEVPAGAPDVLAMAAGDLAEVARMRVRAAAAVTAAAPVIRVVAEVRGESADRRAAQGYAISEEASGGRLTVRVVSSTAEGAAYGLYAIAERLGAAWYHPAEPVFVPADPAATLPDDLASASSVPAMDLRGYHQHTQHPIPFSDFVLAPKPEWRPYLTGYFRWLLRNRQNGFQWHMLSTVDLPAWRDHGRWIVDEAHRHGVRVGMVVAFADKQQNGFRLIPDLGEAMEGAARIDHQRKQLRQGLDALWAMDLGLDHLHVSFATSEMTAVSDAEVLAWFEELVAWAGRLPAATVPELFAHLHVPGKVMQDDGKTPFYHLPLRASPQVGLFVHTTMFYDLEHPAPVYGNEDFHHAQVPFASAKGRRRLVYFPETAWWLGFDNSLPLHLPITGWARAHDLGSVLPRVMGNIPLDGHVTFTTGIEWNYWMYDHFLARATWDPSYGWDRYVADVSALYGPAAPAVVTATKAVTDLQVAAFFGDNPLIFFYLAGESANDELGAPSGLVGRPVKRPFWDVFHLDDAGLAAWKARDLDPLCALRDGFAAAAAALAAAAPGESAGEDVADRFFELRSSHEILAWRAEHSALLYGGVVDARAGDETAAYAKLAAARAVTEKVRERVGEVEQRVYRYPLALCAEEKPGSPTAYPFGDLFETRTAHFWQRRDDQLQALLDVAFGKVPEAFPPGYDSVYATDPAASELTEPDVDEGVRSLLKAYVPRMLLAIGGGGATLAVGEDLNGNGLPDPGTIVEGPAPTFGFTVLPLAIGDSANPLGTLNLRGGTVTATLDAGAPVRLEIAARVEFKDLLDALEATGMFDQETGWQMVAPLFGFDPAATPRPVDFPMRFAAPLSTP